MQKNNKSGFTGVHLSKWNMKWAAAIKVNGCSKFLGYFDDAQEAHEAYLIEKQSVHTFNPVPRANHNQGSLLIGKGFEQKELFI